MSNATTNPLKAGATVKYARPLDAREAEAQFTVVELRGDRVLIRLRCDLPIPPTEVVAVEEVTAAD